MLRTFNTRGLIIYIHDIVMTAISFILSVYLRVGDSIRWISIEELASGAFVVSATGTIVYWRVGLYRGVWRYASVKDLTAIAKAVCLTLLIFLLIMFLWTRLEDLPRSLPFINGLVLIAMLGGPRLAYRIYRDKSFDLHDAPGGKRRITVLLAGAGDESELFIRALAQDRNPEYKVIGILTDKPHRIGQQIHGVSIIDTIDNYKNAVGKLSKHGARPQRLILTKDSYDGSVVRHLLDQCTEMGIKLGRVPRLTDFRSGIPDKTDIRPIDLEDLLGRPQTTLDKDAIENFIAGKRVLITGAGGSIGREIVRQVVALNPEKVGLLDISEFGLYQIEQDVNEWAPELKISSAIADVRNTNRIDKVFSCLRPDIVFHAAAMKHVPLVENNCCEGIGTNVLGTINVANAAMKYSVEKMVMISTDKAINSTSIMGASKRLAEQYCQALDLSRGEEKETNFVTVRFGNVLGSTGSVVPLFQKQLRNGGPLTVTHPDMTRYFMTIREAVELVLLASAKAKSERSQDGKVFVLDMGEPIRIMDLAEQMIRLAGYTPGRDIDIEITGCRPGEKLFEEIFHDAEQIVKTETEGVMLAAPRTSSLEELKVSLDSLTSFCKDDDEMRAVQLLASLVPESHLERIATANDETSS